VLDDPRALAHDVLSRVLYKGAYADIVLGSALARSALNPPDRALATEIVYGVLRRLLSIDWALDGFLRSPVAGTPASVALALRIGAYQLLFLDRIPAYAAVHTAVELARARAGRGAVPLVNAVLRRLAGEGPREFPSWSDPVQRIVREHSHPRWLVEQLITLHGVQEAAGMCAANNLPAPTDVRVNLLKCDIEQARQSLESDGLAVEQCRYAWDGLRVTSAGRPLDATRAYKDGLVYVMDEAAMLVAPALAPDRETTVLDACAAPGGKTAHIAGLMRNTGRIVACDLSRSRLQLLSDNCNRLGVTNVQIVVEDAAKIGGRFKAAFDSALVDAPCSGLGVLRRRPDLRWRKEASDIKRLHSLQVAILEGVAASLREGAVLVYCTCSIHPDENGGTVDEFLSRHPEFARDSLKGRVPDVLAREERDGAIQMFTHVHGTDGFYIARLARRKGY
jgi:16S rRNA (cytosine967-C5)-methyltransferase